MPVKEKVNGLIEEEQCLSILFIYLIAIVRTGEALEGWQAAQEK